MDTIHHLVEDRWWILELLILLLALTASTSMTSLDLSWCVLVRRILLVHTCHERLLIVGLWLVAQVVVRPTLEPAFA